MGIKERKIREKEHRIREILTAAKAIFLDKGYNHTTMLDIAERSELSRRTVYLYFKSKEEISFAVMEESFGKLRDKIKTAASQKGDAVERLKSMRQAYLDFYRYNFNDLYFTLYFDLKLNMNNISSTDAQHCFYIVIEIIHILMGVLEDGKNDGSLRPSRNLHRTAFTMITIIHGTMQKVAIQKDMLEHATDFSQEEIINETFNLLYHSVMP